MTRFITCSVAALVLAASSSVLVAQSGQVASSGRRPSAGLGAGIPGTATTCCLSKLTPEVEMRIAGRIDEAWGLTLQGRMTDARRILRDVVTEQERAGAYPAIALRTLANVEYGLGRPVIAAGILVQLADAAVTASDPATELQALVDALILFGQEGRTASARALRPRIKKLLNSPAIPEATRRELAVHFAPQ